MRKFLVSLLCVTAFGYITTNCVAEPLYGVITEERIVNLPTDQAKWYISIVGDTQDTRYQKIVGWFNTNQKLVNLKNQVHYIPVTNDSAIFTERYARNVRALPTVRLQTGDGEVVYEASGDNIPMTAEGLNGAIAERVLPWRRMMEDRCRPQPTPKPSPGPLVDPKPQPIIDVDVPILDKPDEPPLRKLLSGVVVLLLVASSLAGGVAGLVVEWAKLRKKI